MTLNIQGKLLDFDTPQVMGILNVTPDSFYADSRVQARETIRLRGEQILSEGGQMIDVGAYSTRPGATEVTEAEEWQRLELALSVLREAFPEAVISVDTFRAEVAKRCVKEFGVDIINDVSGGKDPMMFATVADLRVPYVLTHSGGVADDAIDGNMSAEEYVPSLCRWLAERLQRLWEQGVADVILDPGFGFGKTLAQNYQIVKRLEDIVGVFPDNPFLIGVSRKSMICKLLEIQPEEALNGTTVMNTLALKAGARILRVHDVRQAVEAVKMIEMLKD